MDLIAIGKEKRKKGERSSWVLSLFELVPEVFQYSAFDYRLSPAVGVSMHQRYSTGGEYRRRIETPTASDRA